MRRFSRLFASKPNNFARRRAFKTRALWLVIAAGIAAPVYFFFSRDRPLLTLQAAAFELLASLMEVGLARWGSLALFALATALVYLAWKPYSKILNDRDYEPAWRSVLRALVRFAKHDALIHGLSLVLAVVLGFALIYELDISLEREARKDFQAVLASRQGAAMAMLEQRIRRLAAKLKAAPATGEEMPRRQRWTWTQSEAVRRSLPAIAAEPSSYLPRLAPAARELEAPPEEGQKRPHAEFLKKQLKLENDQGIAELHAFFRSTEITETDLADLQMLFDLRGLAAADRSLEASPSFGALLAVQADPERSLEGLLESLYFPRDGFNTPAETRRVNSFAALRSREKERTVQRAWGLIRRFGRDYTVPSSVRVTRAIAGGAARWTRRGVSPQLAYMYLALLLRGDEAEDPFGESAREFRLTGPGIKKEITKKLQDAVQENLLNRIEKHRSGSVAYTLNLTYLRARSMVRGPIQLTTIIVFFWGMILLLIKGLVFGLFVQLPLHPGFLKVMGLIKASAGPFEDDDQHESRWIDVMSGQREVGRGNPIMRQVCSAGTIKEAEQLVAGQLIAGFEALEAGAGLHEGVEAIERATADWLEAEDEQYAFIHYVSWVLPSIGFIGTVVGIGQGLALANRVIARDPAIKAIAIGDMTVKLGTAFDTTLIALLCTIPFTLFCFLFRRLQTSFAKSARRTVTRMFLGSVIPRDLEAPRPNSRGAARSNS